MKVLVVPVDFGEFPELEVAERLVFVEVDQKMVADQSHHHQHYRCGGRSISGTNGGAGMVGGVSGKVSGGESQGVVGGCISTSGGGGKTIGIGGGRNSGGGGDGGGGEGTKGGGGGEGGGGGDDGGGADGGGDDDGGGAEGGGGIGGGGKGGGDGACGGGDGITGGKGRKGEGGTRGGLGEGLGVGAKGLFGEGLVGKGHWPQVPNRNWNNGSQFDLVLDLDPPLLPLPLLLLLLPVLVLFLLLPLLFSSATFPSFTFCGCLASVIVWVISSRAKRKTMNTMHAFILLQLASSPVGAVIEEIKRLKTAFDEAGRRFSANATKQQIVSRSMRYK
ncbi:hypothetical protein ACLB2K_000349 [Fragaria x ananassa]